MLLLIIYVRLLLFTSKNNNATNAKYWIILRVDAEDF